MSKRLTTEGFIEKAKKLHDNKYDYSKAEYVNTNTKVCIICPEHGEFWQTPSNHLQGKGCPKCKGKNKTTEEFIEKANIIHNNKYDYSKVEYKSNRTKVCIICPEHGEFWQTPHEHLHGCGCPKCKNIKWNKETCYQEAKKYKTRTEFQKGCNRAYRVVCKNKWLDDYDWFAAAQKPHGYWIYDTCYEEARNYNTISEFIKSSSGAYTVAWKNGWLDDYTWFVDGKIKTLTDKNDSVYKYYWEETNAIYIGRTLMYRQNERANEHQADTDTVGKYAKENGLEVPQMEIIEENITPIEGLEREDYWVNYYKEKGYNVINKAKTGVGSGSLGAINRGKWNKKTVFAEAKKYKTRNEFCKGSNGAYAVARRKGWLSEMDWFNGRKPNGYWNKENVFEEALKYKTKSEFKKGCGCAYHSARKNGWLKEMDWFEEVLKPNGYWNIYENCYAEAKKYKTRSEFKKGSIGAYEVALKHDWMDNYTWMVDGNILAILKRTKWNKKTVFEEAKKYKTRTEFQKGSCGAYSVALKNKWLDEIFPKHHSY